MAPGNDNLEVVWDGTGPLLPERASKGGSNLGKERRRYKKVCTVKEKVKLVGLPKLKSLSKREGKWSRFMANGNGEVKDKIEDLTYHDKLDVIIEGLVEQSSMVEELKAQLDELFEKVENLSLENPGFGLEKDFN